MSNIVLIGMPGTGKSHVGRILADKLNKNFIDTDELLKENLEISLSEFVRNNGMEYFLKYQNDIISKNKFNNTVISTGGAVVLTDELMSFFKTQGKIFFLKTSFEILEKRMDKNRSLAKVKEQTFKQTFDLRQPLYYKYADHTIHCDEKSINEVANEIITKV